MATELMNLDLATFTRNTPVTIKSGGGTMALSVNDVINWLAPGAPVKEALGFLRTCQATGLDPWLREIYLIPMGNSWGTVIAKAGYLRRGMEHPGYDGYESGITIQAIDPKWKPGSGPMVGVGPIIDREGSLLPDGHKLLGGWCRTWKKGETRPYYTQVSFSEFNRGIGPWKSIPCVMIEKVAVSHNFRKAYNMSEVYDDSEMPAMSREQYARYVDVPARRPAIIAHEPTGEAGTIDGMRELEALYEGSHDPHLPPEHVVEINRLVKALDLSPAWLDRTLAKKDAATVADLCMADAIELIEGLQGIASRRAVANAFPGQADKGPDATTFRTGRPLDEETMGGGTEVEDGDGGRSEVERDRPIESEAGEPALAVATASVGGPPDTDLDVDG